MKTLMIFAIAVAGFTAQAAVVQTMNASCNQQKKGILWEVTQETPRTVSPRGNTAPVRTRETVKSKTQGA